jgi:hypothetical protein
MSEQVSVLEIFQDLLREAPGCEPHDIRVTGWFDDETQNTPESLALWNDFVCEYQELVEEVSRTWGQPEFNGHWEEPEFPSWHHWVAHLAYWRRGEAMAYVECDQQGSEAPMGLCIGVKAGEELEEDYS